MSLLGNIPILRDIRRSKYPKPVRVFWWLEQICNLRCNHCDIGKRTLLAKFRPALPLEKKKEVLKKVVEWIGKPFSLSFIAGEPFLHQDLLPIIREATSFDLITSLTSNGTLISSPVRAKEIVESGLSFIAISIDGINSQFHDESRGIPGTWEKATKTVLHLLKQRKKSGVTHPRVYINCIIMRGNLTYITDLVRWAKTVGADGITFQPIASTDLFAGSGTGGDYWYKTSPLWPETEKALALVDELYKMKLDGFPIKNTETDFYQFRSYFKDPVLFGKTGACEGELKSALITQDGFLKMCPNIRESFGNVLNTDLDDLWNSSSAARARKHVYECELQCKILANNKEEFYF